MEGLEETHISVIPHLTVLVLVVLLLWQVPKVALVVLLTVVVEEVVDHQQVE
jgi:hypothetical protein